MVLSVYSLSITAEVDERRYEDSVNLQIAQGQHCNVFNIYGYVGDLFPPRHRGVCAEYRATRGIVYPRSQPLVAGVAVEKRIKVSIRVVELALKAQDPSKQHRWRLDLTKRRLPKGNNIDKKQAREGIAERLLSMLGNMALMANTRNPGCKRLLVVEGENFVEFVKADFARRLGIRPVTEFDKMMHVLAQEFRQWVRSGEATESGLEPLEENDQIYLLCPED